MLHYRNQKLALEAAAELVAVLPPETRWAVTATEADTWEDPTTMNVYMKPGDSSIRIAIAKQYSLGSPVDEGEDFKSYRIGPLLVSLVVAEDA